jgi:hypothetical protein
MKIISTLYANYTKDVSKLYKVISQLINELKINKGIKICSKLEIF